MCVGLYEFMCLTRGRSPLTLRRGLWIPPWELGVPTALWVLKNEPRFSSHLSSSFYLLSF